ncbi:transaldolase [Halomonas denitrificans]|uniref:transaldolase n=1 Tax=Halomonas TaxID=2745 RepID=UPI001A8CE8A9|nr:MULTISPECIES: transaldolase [Halomonas]MED5296709.1 transaldolase [Pseudomonadota bacterium]MBN8410744.1 transaldolase [Halomonas litopenaei]MBY5925670.1 transaldolase [Halomonas sp. DP4Y7-2]MBY5930652.1 transaldolase [Halomonas sp. DP8Y7-3]MBY5969292.1 transaldolase [Halomonas denitrificans]
MADNLLDQLKAMTTVVADTGDLDAIRRFQPTDATTNPSLILQAAGHDDRRARLAAIAKEANDIDDALDAVAVEIGSEISELVPGYVSTEVSARLSFDTDATLARAHSLIERYGRHGVGAERILIKVASTWEGIRAAKVLEREGIRTNLTLLFSFAQAQACADAGVTLISPFVGRILDWHKAQQPDADFSGDNDPGVQSVKRIYDHYKGHGYSTIVMGASFRNTDEVKALAGCDRLTISPNLLEELQSASGDLPRRLTASDAETRPPEPQSEADFRWAMNEDAMATEKLAEGIRKFMADQRKLETLLADLRSS